MSKYFGFPIIDIYNYDPRFTEYEWLCFVSNADLPKFDGNTEMFDDFKDKFFLLIGKHKMDEARKMNVLKMCLTGIARKYINFLPSTVDESFDKLETWLKIHQQLMLAELPSIRYSTNSWELYEFWAIATRLFKKLNTTGNFLVDAFRKKLPIRLAQRLSPCCKMKELMYKIHRIARVTMCKENIQNEKLYTKQRRWTELEFCKFCSMFGCHQFESCPVYTTPETRKERAIALKMCFSCLEKGHPIQDCRKFSELCYRCHKEHKVHAFLCKYTQENN